MPGSVDLCGEIAYNMMIKVNKAGAAQSTRSVRAAYHHPGRNALELYPILDREGKSYGRSVVRKKTLGISGTPLDIYKVYLAGG